MKAKVLDYGAIGLVVVWVIAFFWILSISGGCSQVTSMFEEHGICLARRIMGLSCPIGIELAFGVGGGLQAKARGYPFIYGFLLGFFLSVMGALFVMTWSPRQPGVPRPYVSPEEKAVKRKRMVIYIAILVVIILFGILLSIKNRGGL